MPQNHLPPGASRWPQQLPYPRPVRRPPWPVPNAESVDFPDAQFAQDYLPPGSPSFTPYNWDPHYKVLYGTGGIYDTKTPRNAQAGVSNDCGCGCGGKSAEYGGCGCSGYGSLDELSLPAKIDDKSKQHLALAFAAGVIFGSLLAKRRR